MLETKDRLQAAEKLQSRNIGLDLMRIGAMMGVLVLHILSIGGVLGEIEKFTNKFWVAWFLELCAFCSVDLFGLLSGYLSCNKKKFSTYRILDLITTLMFYCCVITLLFNFFGKDLLGEEQLISSGLKAYEIGGYWYVFAYVMVFLLMPYMNLLINAIDDKALGRLCLMLFLLFSVLPTVLQFDLFRLGKGYSFPWLLACYMFGAYLRRTGKTFFKHFELPICILSVIVMLGIQIFVFRRRGVDEYYKIRGTTANYLCPLVLLCAVMLVQLAGRMKTEKVPVWIKRIVVSLSSVAFDVYIMHCHVFVWDEILNGSFKWVANYRTALFPFVLLAATVAMYLVCSLVGGVRILLFKVLGINKFLKFISSKPDKILYPE